MVNRNRGDKKMENKNNEKCQHQYVPNVGETRKQNKGIWTCIKCSKHISVEEALSYIKGEGK